MEPKVQSCHLRAAEPHQILPLVPLGVLIHSVQMSELYRHHFCFCTKSPSRERLSILIIFAEQVLPLPTGEFTHAAKVLLSVAHLIRIIQVPKCRR